ncbi:MAG: hypothetical protein DYH08_03450 [Actinobacteria bacterium ATB1]|nr:hypothetical protein [Actinobacteria bacterium ATB1]
MTDALPASNGRGPLHRPSDDVPRQYPWPVPFGWYQVAWTDELAPGEVKPLHYFGRHLVLWREETGEARLNDAFCPHLGAHLGHGGKVSGSLLVCPFHGWEFDAEGRNCRIPYSEKVNKTASTRAYPMRDVNGLLMAWYHPFDEKPLWEIPALDEFAGDPDWTEPVARDFVIKAAWQELAENSVDSAHFHFVHHTDVVPELESYEYGFPTQRMRSKQRFPTPQGVVDGRIDVDTVGPGFGVTRFSGIVDTALMGCNTPINAHTCHLRFTFSVKRLGDDAGTSTVGRAFVNEVTNQVIEDIPIWENKAFVPRPALADTDGPYMKFRKWASQFYAEGVDDGVDYFVPPPPDPRKPIEVVELGRTSAARHRSV